MSEHARIVDTRPVEFRDIPPSVRADWIASGNPKASEFVPVEEDPKPSYDAARETVEPEYTLFAHAGNPADDYLRRGWIVRPLTADELRQTWTSLDFLARFNTPEMEAIEIARLSDPIVQSFYRAALAAQEVVSDDPRTVAGLDYLIAVGILTNARKAEILGDA